jgi:hypothetical protein
MKERPILFNAEMVRAILDGRKTQTRRVVKLPLRGPTTGGEVAGCEINSLLQQGEEFGPFGTVGDRLWVRETWQAYRLCSMEYNEWDACDGPPSEMLERYGRPTVEYAATSDSVGKWRPSLHMPRWASRIDLEITAVRVERLQEITDFDAFQEGAKSEPGTITGPYCMSFKQGFRTLWQSIYGNWDANPWGWVYEFRKM